MVSRQRKHDLESCPECGTTFDTVADRPVCPKCGHKFHRYTLAGAFRTGEFPRWVAPALGAALGAFFGLKVAAREKQLLAISVGVVVGMLGGISIYFGEWVKELRAKPEAESRNFGAVLSLVLLAMSCIPVIGLVMSLIAIHQTRGRSKVALTAFMIAFVVNGMILMIATDRMGLW